MKVVDETRNRYRIVYNKYPRGELRLLLIKSAGEGKENLTDRVRLTVRSGAQEKFSQTDGAIINDEKPRCIELVRKIKKQCKRWHDQRTLNIGFFPNGNIGRSD